MAGFFQHVAESVAKIPLVGKGLAKPIGGLAAEVKVMAMLNLSPLNSTYESLATYGSLL